MALRIAQVGPLWENIPPPKYGGTERIVHYLTEGLVQRGHDVTLFACGTSKTSAHLISIYPRPLFRDHIPWTNITYPLLNMTEALDRHEEFDIIHIHLNKSSDYLALPLSAPVWKKVVFTLHFPYPTAQNRTDRHLVLQKYKYMQYVSISNSQRTGGENLNWVSTVYNGVDTKLYTLNKKRSDYFLWVGKFNPDKGTREAIRAAKQAGVKLLVVGAIDNLEGADAIYYKEEVAPLIDNDNIKSIGEVSDTEKNKLYGEALAFLNPIQWNEPFGLVMAEAQATGCPVISYANGAAPEIVIDTKTGYLINDKTSDGVAGLVDAIKKISALSSKEYNEMVLASRQNVEKRFSTDMMVQEYEKVYKKITLLDTLCNRSQTS